MCPPIKNFCNKHEHVGERVWICSGNDWVSRCIGKKWFSCFFLKSASKSMRKALKLYCVHRK